MKKADAIARGRRQVLRTMGTTIAAAVAAPSLAVAGQHVGHALATSKAAAAPAPPTSPAAPALPTVLDAHERATLAALGDQLVPGSSAAGVPALIDRVLATESPDVLRKCRNALGAFEREARTRHSSTWVALSEAQRLAILREAAALRPSVAPRAGWRPGAPVLSTPPAAPPPPTLRDHLDALRNTVARAYLSTEAGATEFGWTGSDVFESLPACTRATSSTR